MTTVKTTINIDEDTWNRFKKTVFSRYGAIRNLSDAVEEAIKSIDAEEQLSLFMKESGIDADTYPSLKEVVDRRVKLETSAGEEVREMREKRVASISGHE